MVSFMRSFVNASLFHRRLMLRTWLLCFSSLWLLFTPVTTVSAEGFVIKKAETVLENEVYLLNASMDLKFSNDALEALRSGVPLIVLVNLEVNQERNWWWDKTVATLQQGYLLLYHALSEKFIIHNLNSGAQHNFISLSAALSALGHINKLPLIDAKLLQPGNHYYVQMRVYLDIESLPAPMRPIAYISSQWQLESDWYTWPLNKQ